MEAIHEIENDESPNRKTAQRENSKPFHMGFQVEESKEPRYLTRMYVDEEEKIPDDLEPAWEEAMAKCA